MSTLIDRELSGAGSNPVMEATPSFFFLFFLSVLGFLFLNLPPPPQNFALAITYSTVYSPSYSTSKISALFRPFLRCLASHVVRPVLYTFDSEANRYKKKKQSPSGCYFGHHLIISR